MQTLEGFFQVKVTVKFKNLRISKILNSDTYKQNFSNSFQGYESTLEYLVYFQVF